MDKKIFRLLTLGIMLTIFWFSNQDANVSDTQSGFFAMRSLQPNQTEF